MILRGNIIWAAAPDRLEVRRRACLVSHGETVAGVWDDLPPEYAGEARDPEALLAQSGSLAERMDAYEGQIIRDAYRRWGTTVAVARELGISQATAARKVAKYVHHG